MTTLNKPTPEEIKAYLERDIDKDGIITQHVPTTAKRKLCRDLYFAGVSPQRIAKRFKITVATLYKYYEEDMDDKKEEKIIKISNLVYDDAVKGDKASRDTILKCVASWANAKPQEQKDKDEKIMTLLEKVVDKL
jgi:hypothetical protein